MWHLEGMLVASFSVDNFLIGKKCVNLLRRSFSDFLDDHVLLVDLTKMGFQHDGASAIKLAPS